MPWTTYLLSDADFLSERMSEKRKADKDSCNKDFTTYMRYKLEKASV